MLFQDYNQILKSVSKPTRYLGNEINAIVKDWLEVKTRIALCFPDTYEIGMSHLGLKILYHYLNKNKNWAAERVYMPWLDMIKLLREREIPLFALESGQPLSRFDIVGFSFQYELEYTNVLEMLDLGGIPVWSQNRNDSDPIVLAGGPVAFNPEPMSPFIDAYLIGDGEVAFPEIIDTIEKLKEEGESRNAILKKISKITGVYVPMFYEDEKDTSTGLSYVRKSAEKELPFPVKRSLLKDINLFPFPDDIIVPFGRIVHDRIAIELARGCTQGCRFCQAGTIYRPARDRDPESVVESIHNAITKTGYDEASLTSLSSADYTGIEMLAEKLMNDLEEKETALSISSLRVYGITEALAKQIARVRKTGFTVAPEAGSQRLRDIINKGITEEDILSGVSNAFNQGWSTIKLYLMIGLPGETEADVEAISDLAKKIMAIGRDKIGNRVKLNLSVNTFIPKPHTAFQWAELVPEEIIRQRQLMILNEIKSDKAISISFNDYRISKLEVILSRGDRQLSDVIFKAWKNGAILDAWDEQFKSQIWDDAFSKNEIDITNYTGSIKEDSILPWDHVDTGVEKRFLHDEYKKALDEKTTLPCEQPVLHSSVERVAKIKEDAKYVCYNCGIECDLKEIQKRQKKAIAYLEKAVARESTKSDSEASITDPQQRFHYVVQFAKTGNMQYVSQLDFLKLLTHAFRKAGVSISLSQGFNPRPKFWFPVSLGVGIEGLKEYFGFLSPEEMEVETIADKLNRSFPRGLSVAKVEKLSSEEVKRYKRMETQCYRLFTGDMDADLLARRISRVLNEEKIVIERFVKKKRREVNIRPLIKAIQYDTDNQYIDITCHITDTAGIRPENLTDLLLKKQLSETKVQRLWVS